MLGCGNVGAALVALVQGRHDEIVNRTGIDLDVARVAVRSLTRQRPVHLAEPVLTRDAADVVADPSIDVVVEVIGGIEPARELILAALANGKPVVTANKELLANHGAELYAAAAAAEVDLLFEAAVAGGIPILRPLRESLVGEDVRRIMGIVNGTTNFILTRMTEARGPTTPTPWPRPRQLGFAERPIPPPTWRASTPPPRSAIVASIAFGADVVRRRRVPPRASAAVTADRHRLRRQRHRFVVKLLGGGRARRRTRRCRARRRPAPPRSACGSIPPSCPTPTRWPSVRESYNAVFVQGGAVGRSHVLRPRRRWGTPRRQRRAGRSGRRCREPQSGKTHASGPHRWRRRRIRPVDESSRAVYYVSIQAADRPGVLRGGGRGLRAPTASRSASMEQEGPATDSPAGAGDGDARIEFITHRAERGGRCRRRCRAAPARDAGRDRVGELGASGSSADDSSGS